MASITVQGNFKNAEAILKAGSKLPLTTRNILQRYGEMGVALLSQATPVRTGLTASSWYYEINTSKHGSEIVWKNSHIEKGVMIAIILQYGHGTRNGGYVQGIDYINPAMQPIFDAIADEAWKEVTSI